MLVVSSAGKQCWHVLGSCTTSLPFWTTRTVSSPLKYLKVCAETDVCNWPLTFPTCIRVESPVCLIGLRFALAITLRLFWLLSIDRSSSYYHGSFCICWVHLNDLAWACCTLFLFCRMAQIFADLRRPGLAVEILEGLLKPPAAASLDAPTRQQYQERLAAAKKLARWQKTPDHYKLLGVEKAAAEEEIRRWVRGAGVLERNASKAAGLTGHAEQGNAGAACASAYRYWLSVLCCYIHQD